MTGRYPHVNGLMWLAHTHWELDEDERILPNYLGDAGDETHPFGLQHITQETDKLRDDHTHSERNLYPGVSPSVHQANRARAISSVVASFLERTAFDEPFLRPSASPSATESRRRPVDSASIPTTTTRMTWTAFGRYRTSPIDGGSARA